LHIADVWKNADEKFIPEQNRRNPSDQIPHAMVFTDIFDDETVWDAIRHNVMTPIFISFANI